MHLEALQESFLSDINVHLGYTCYFGGHIGFGITMTLPFIILTPETDFSP